MSSPLNSSGLRWRKSSRSSAQGNDCVEVASADRVIAVRDSKNPSGPMLAIGRDAWSVFSRRIAAGELDH